MINRDKLKWHVEIRIGRLDGKPLTKSDQKFLDKVTGPVKEAALKAGVVVSETSSREIKRAQ